MICFGADTDHEWIISEKKETKDSIIFQYFNHFSDEKEIDEIKKEFEDGIGWGDAKKKLFTKIM